ncbi:hypothetical protein PWT90_03269 [Aphanocladium album]|nr:hypothetical protein PWT90_03269 [Aphanocladium album]
MPKSASLSTSSRKRSFVEDGGDDRHETEVHCKKTTLHKENQERAYIAASRRTDRSLEARYQSALMASEVHKKRTGRSLRITYKIVEDEEMYEEEDQGLPESWQLSQNGYRSRTLSQTDAYIAALIARKAGMQNYFEYNNALFASPLFNHGAWAGQAPSMPSYSNAAHPAHPSTGYGDSTESFTSLAEFDFGSEAKAVPQAELDTDPVADSPVFSGNLHNAHRSSSDSSISDSLSYSPNYMCEPSSEAIESSPDTFNLRLEDCLVDTEGEGFLNLTQNGLLVGYD